MAALNAKSEISRSTRTDESGAKANSVFPRARSLSHLYSKSALLSIFFAGFSIYLGEYFIAGFLTGIAMLVIPLLAYNDRITFDGKRLVRTGVVAWFFSFFRGVRIRLKVSDIEQVDTQSMRMLRRGWNIRYRYQTSFRGRGIIFSVVSSGDEYLKLVRAVLPLLPDNVLDNKSIEVRDYLTKASSAMLKANESQIPAVDVLEGSFREMRANRRTFSKSGMQANTESEPGKADKLRQLANELRLSGSLLRSAEAFRRALLLAPRDAWLLFDFARCLQSMAGAERDDSLERKAAAMLRLAEKRAGKDADLLTRLGETYFLSGECKRAGIMFQRALEIVDESFRAVRGMAEIALLEGKIAHVVHNFSAANRLAETSALRRWTKAEMDYFSRLNDDEEYMELEVGRVNLLDSLDRSRRTAIRAAVFGLPAIIFGIVAQDYLIANIGWAISIVGLAFWSSILFFRRFFEPRLPFELFERDRMN